MGAEEKRTKAKERKLEEEAKAEEEADRKIHLKKQKVSKYVKRATKKVSSGIAQAIEDSREGKPSKYKYKGHAKVKVNPIKKAEWHAKLASGLAKTVGLTKKGKEASEQAGQEAAVKELQAAHHKTEEKVKED